MTPHWIAPRWIRPAHAAIVFGRLPETAVSFEPNTVNAEQRAYLNVVVDGDYVEGDCFANARRIVLRDYATRFQFCEGYLFVSDAESRRVVAYNHAWVLLDGAIVVELSTRLSPTEQQFDFGEPLKARPVGRFPSKWLYVGVALPSDALGATEGRELSTLPTTIEDPSYIKAFIRMTKLRQPLWDEDDICEYVARDLEMSSSVLRSVYPHIFRPRPRDASGERQRQRSRRS